MLRVRQGEDIHYPGKTFQDSINHHFFKVDDVFDFSQTANDDKQEFPLLERRV